MDELCFSQAYVIFHEFQMFHNFWRLPCSFQEETQFSSLCCLLLCLCTPTCMYTQKWASTELCFSAARIPSFSLTNLQLPKHPFLSSFSSFNTTIVLPVLHLSTAKSFFGNTKKQRKSQKQSPPEKSYRTYYLLICLILIEHWQITLTSYRQGGDVDCLL